MLTHTCPDNLKEGGWPMSMPNLNTIVADTIPDWSPQHLIGYSQLRHLDIRLKPDGGPTPAMPTWLSQLPQLEVSSFQL